MSWYKWTYSIPEGESREIAMAWLSTIEISSIVEHDDNIEVYFDENCLGDLRELLVEKFNIQSPDFDAIPDQNWNKVWEASFNPIQVGDFYIRADFHEPSDELNELIISPKMAFGTGHHETTYLMLDYMQRMNFNGLSVFDYGCGTAILSVMAALLGAKNITAIDIQEEAIENSIEHFELNGISIDNHLIKQGDLEDIEADRYDVILANINYNVISARSMDLYNRLNKDGTLLVSGILNSKFDEIAELYRRSGFTLEHSEQRGEWSMFVFRN